MSNLLNCSEWSPNPAFPNTTSDHSIAPIHQHKPSSEATVLFSGGQDSTTCLFWALHNFSHVSTVGFSYNQTNKIELQCRNEILRKIRFDFPSISKKLGNDKLIDLDFLPTITNLPSTETPGHNQTQSNTFIPGRNIIFLVAAAISIYKQKSKTLIIGATGSDIHPDSKKIFFDAMNIALNIGMEANFSIIFPLIKLNKSLIWQLANNLGGIPLINLIKNDTHTCYLDERRKFHGWGYGCGTCPACKAREFGYNEWLHMK